MATKTMRLVREDPPERVYTRSVSRWETIAELARAKPDVWFRVEGLTLKNPVHKRYVRKFGLDVSFRKESRDGDYMVYAKYVGSEDD